MPKCAPAPACGDFVVPKCDFAGTVCDKFYEPICEVEKPKEKCEPEPKKKCKKSKKSKQSESEDEDQNTT